MSKNVKKIIWIDVGTHFGQEYQSVFGPNYIFLLNLIRRFVGRYFLRRGEMISPKDIYQLVINRRILNNKRYHFFVVFIEANPVIVTTKKIYLSADAVFNIGLTDENANNFHVSKLFLANGDETSQGSSFYEAKGNVKVTDYVLCGSVSADSFMYSLKEFLDSEFKEYEILLRLNCEGAEDSVIYACRKAFGNKFQNIMGSLKDVKEVKGSEAHKKLEQFIHKNKISNTLFSSSVNTWNSAQKTILSMLQ